jgi:hypothetical protein
MSIYASDLDRIKTALVDLMVRASGQDKPPEMLYHYTDFEGFKGIVEKRTLRATQIKSLNDSTERTHGENVIGEVLKNAVGDNNRERISSGMIEQSDQARWFVTCFCEQPKLLSMWRAYSDRGGGYCLGFDAHKLRRLVPLQGSAVNFNWLFKMVYGLCTTELTQILHELANLIEEDPDFTLGFIFAHILAGKIKHEAFKEEQEWRIILDSPKIEAINFRQGHATIIPYVELQQAQGLPLREIFYGPTLRHDGDLRKTIELMLLKYGYSDMKVESCGIPYRLP